MNPSSFAKAVGVTRRTVYNWMESNKIPSVRIGRTWRISYTEACKGKIQEE